MPAEEIDLGPCEYGGGCRRKARFSIYRTYPSGRKHWVNLCDKHERIVAAENEKRAGGVFVFSALEFKNVRL